MCAGPNLDKKCVQFSDAARPFHEILTKFYFVVKLCCKKI